MTITQVTSRVRQHGVPSDIRSAAADILEAWEHFETVLGAWIDNPARQGDLAEDIESFLDDCTAGQETALLRAIVGGQK